MRPLDGVRVLDLSRFQACPLCGMMLADMGAEVIRIEAPNGGPDRTWGQWAPDGETILYKIVCRNKKGITLRLEKPEGLRIFHDLIRKSDVVLHNYTPGAPISEEVSYDRLRMINPSIIAAAVSGYGQTGPDAEKPCFDAVAQARSGGMVLTGFSGDPPLKTTVTYVDLNTGLMATVGVLLALRHRDRTGIGQAVDVSLFDTASFATQSLGTLLLYTFFGELRTQVGNNGFHSFAGCFRSKDKWIMINPATDGIWKRFVKTIGHPDMARDQRFKTDMDRFRNSRAIEEVVGSWVSERTSKECITILDRERIPCSVVKTVDEAIEDQQVLARNMIINMEYPGLGMLPIPGIPIKLSRTPGSVELPAPALGEHNKEVYGSLLGFSDENLQQLKIAGII